MLPQQLDVTHNEHLPTSAMESVYRDSGMEESDSPAKAGADPSEEGINLQPCTYIRGTAGAVGWDQHKPCPAVPRTR